MVMTPGAHGPAQREAALDRRALARWRPVRPEVLMWFPGRRFSEVGPAMNAPSQRLRQNSTSRGRSASAVGEVAGIAGDCLVRGAWRREEGRPPSWPA
ncbi:MAG: hypothetical protein ACK5LS_03790 [Propioniciclava sp.]